MPPTPTNGRFREAMLDLVAFGWKEAWSCIFAGSFFMTLFLSKYLPLGPLPRYDFILLVALALQAMMLLSRLETLDEFKTLMVFHLLGFALEVFKTHPAIGSWSYPEPAYSKVFGVPLYSGFMYAAVASYMIQAWRRVDLKLVGHPPLWQTAPLGAAIYLNFFTHHVMVDLRWVLIAVLVVIYGRTWVYFRPRWRYRRLPMPLAFLLIGFFVWLAENMATFLGAWQYPDQVDLWRRVHWGKITSWSLLAVVTFILVAELKHFKATRLASADALPGRSAAAS